MFEEEFESDMNNDSNIFNEIKMLNLQYKKSLKNNLFKMI